MRTNERHVDRRRLIEQPLLAIDLDQLDEIFFRPRVDFAATEARIDVGMQAHASEKTRAAGGAAAVELAR